ncbi:MAG: hypothetical protein J7494_01380 [Sphingobium sp.]|nr:hypothetical protein [Sphingobium sp.]
MTIAWRMLPAVPLAGLLIAGAAQAETTAGATIGVEGGYGSNPLLDSSVGESGSLIGRIEPTLKVVGPTTQLAAFGRVEHIIFSKLYPDMTNWSLGSTVALTLSPRSKFSLSGGYSSQVQTTLSGLLPLPGEEDPVLDPSGAELGGQRIKNLNGSARFTSQVSARDEITVDAFVSDVDYDSSIFTGYSYTSYGGSLGLSHAMNARTSLGASVSYSKSNYDSAAFGDFQQITPSLNASFQLSPRLTLSTSAGISFSQIKLPTGTSNETHFSGQAELCYKGLRSNFCANASRSLGSTARSGSSTITIVGANYSYKLTPRSSLTLNAQYAETQSIDIGGANVDYGYGVASASYQQELGRRLSFSVTARYTEPFKSVSGRRKGFYGGAGINYRLGR